MKLLNILSHPYTLIISFLVILISGEHLGGFYVSYILLALPHGGIHAILAVLGIVILLVNYQVLNRRNISSRGLLNISGLVMLLASIILFFVKDKQHYNWATFEQVLPLVTLIIFFIIACCFSINNIVLTNLHRPMNHDLTTSA